jgi:hypothetical protein
MASIAAPSGARDNECVATGEELPSSLGNDSGDPPAGNTGIVVNPAAWGSWASSYSASTVPLHDLIAGTVVIYAWDTRAARLRFLARQAEVGSPPQAHSAGVTTPPAPVVIVTQ